MAKQKVASKQMAQASRIPLKRVEVENPRTHVAQAKRTEGKVLAKGKLEFTDKDIRFSSSKKEAKVKALLEHLKDTLQMLKKDHGKTFVAGLIKEAAKAKSVPVVFSWENRVLMETRVVGENIELVIDADVSPDFETDPSSMTSLLAMGLVGQMSAIAGADQRTVMHRCLDFFLLLSGRERVKLINFLQMSRWDSSDSLAVFFRSVTDLDLALFEDNANIALFDGVDSGLLKETGSKLNQAIASNKDTKKILSRLTPFLKAKDDLDEPWSKVVSGQLNTDEQREVLEEIERVLKYRDKWVSWLMGQMRIDMPYNQLEVIDLLSTEMEDVDEKRALINESVSKSYSPQIEGANIHRISDWALENDINLVSGRLSRAFGNQAHLLSAAKYINERSVMLKPVEQLTKLAEGIGDLDTHLTRISSLVSRSTEVPYAQLKGAVDNLEKALIAYQNKAEKKLIAKRNSSTESVFDNTVVQGSHYIQQLNDRLNKLFDQVEKLREALMQSEKRDAAYVIMMQRFHPGETINLANANSAREVHPGKEEDLRDLARIGGHNTYSSPGNGTHEVAGEIQNANWVTKVGDWIEAIPLFIHEHVVRKTTMVGGEPVDVDVIETAVDQEAMEAFFRAHAGYWAQNIDEVTDSYCVEIARQAAVSLSPSLKKEVAAVQETEGVTFGEAARQVLATKPKADEYIATVAGAVLESLNQKLGDICRTVEQKQVDRLDAMKEILLGNDKKKCLIQEALELSTKSLKGLAEACLQAANQKVKKQIEADSIRLQPLAFKKTRRTPNLHILTTESAGMTEGYVQTWIEEEIALYNVVRGKGLEKKVNEKLQGYRERIAAVGEKVIDEFGMSVVVEEFMAEQKLNRSQAAETVIFSYKPVAEEVGKVATLLEHFKPEFKSENLDVSEPQEVLDYIEHNIHELEADAVPKVAENNGHAFAMRVNEWMEENPDHSFELATRAVINADDDYEEELQSLVLSSARSKVLAHEDRENPEQKLKSKAANYLREHTQLARSMARKETVAEAGLHSLLLSSEYYYQASGPNKRYNLLYTPSRVNLGENERDSVAVWKQWVGGADSQAAQAGFNFYSLINEGGVEERPALAHAEIQKTAENALCVTHFAGSNALGLLVNAVLEGDVEDMADQMNLRGDRYIPPAGEGYGGYCVPKDGLFLAFVLSLTNDVKLRQMGIPEHLHEGVMALAKRAIYKQKDFPTAYQWQSWAAKELLSVEQLKEYFDVREDGLLVFHITKIANTIQRLGEPWSGIASGTLMLSNLAARWSVEHMIINAEQVNRFMTFYKAWMIYQSLAEARKEIPYAATDDRARIALSAEYKPVQDVRFSTGMRLFEMFAGTCDHLIHSLDEEGQNLAYLMLYGFDPDTEDALGRRAVQEVYRQLGISSKDEDKIARLKEAFPKHGTPAELVMTSVTMSSTKDMLFYTSDTRLDQIADRVQVKLGDFGLSEEQIEANCISFGGDLRQWAGMKNLPKDQLEKAVSDIGGEIHALALKLKGPGRNYETDIQGVDVLNTGIPFPELLELLDDAPKTVALMLNGNPNSALAITDGTAGRNRRCFTFRDIQNFFAACEKYGRKGIYKAVGLGENNIVRLREDMHEKRARGLRIAQALQAVADASGVRDRNEAIQNAFDVYSEIVDRILVTDEPSKAIREEERLKRYKKWKPGDTCISEALARVRTGLSLQELDIATWLEAFGGMFVTMAEDQEKIDEMLNAIREGVAQVDKYCRAKKVKSQFTGKSASKQDIELAMKNLARPKFVPEVQKFTQEMLVESSSKAVEVAAIEALERRQALRARAARARAFGQREEGFNNALDSEQKLTSEEYCSSARKKLDIIEKICNLAFETDGDLEDMQTEKCHRAFGRFLANTRNYLVAIAREGYDGGSDEDAARLVDFQAHTALAYTGREIILEDWKLLAGGYEDLGDIARLAEKVKDDEAMLAKVADAVEFFYITLALGQTLEFALQRKEDVDVRLFWKRGMDFFAETINDHFYPYSPWAFSRGVGFADFQNEELYNLSNKHHAWLYKYLYKVLLNRTDYGDYAPEERNALVGNFLGENAVAPIGGEAGNAGEKRWRAYNQIRELIFMRGDGFEAPVVFPEFDPEIIDAHKRVNLVFLYPVGRTHISRAFREGPTLNKQLKADGEPGLNMIVTRYGELVQLPDAKKECLMIADGHMYLSEQEFITALMQHKGYSDEDARAEAELERTLGRLTDKGIRAAVRFTENGNSKPIIAATIFPFHGLPIYETGKLEEAGLPATVQTVIFTELTYDKSLYPKIFDKKSGVRLPEEIDWERSYGKGKNQKQILDLIKKGVSKSDYPGLVKFREKCPIILIKGAAESGARNLKVFDLSAGREEDIDKAAIFVYEVGKTQNVVIQEAVLTSPEFWAGNNLMNQFVERQILEWNRPVNRDKYPRSQIYGSLRIVTSSAGPDKPYDTAFPISLISLQVATNVGRGGTLEPLMERYIQEEHREAIIEGLKSEVPKVMDALARYAEKKKDDFEAEHGWEIGKDLRGVPYSWPSYMMLDYLVAPTFKRQGALVDIEPFYDDKGERTGSRILMEDKQGRFYGEITGWQFIHLEPNIGIGLWDRYNLREEELERSESEAEGREFNWDNVGTSDRIVLKNFAIAGRQYLEANLGS